MQAQASESFLPAWLYTEPDVHRWDCSTYAGTVLASRHSHISACPWSVPGHPCWDGLCC